MTDTTTENTDCGYKPIPLTHRDKYPCKGCAERSLGCWSTCKKYTDAKKIAEERKKLEYTNKYYDSNCTACELKRFGRKPAQR